MPVPHGIRNIESDIEHTCIIEDIPWRYPVKGLWSAIIECPRVRGNRHIVGTAATVQGDIFVLVHRPVAPCPGNGIRGVVHRYGHGIRMEITGGIGDIQCHLECPCIIKCVIWSRAEKRLRPAVRKGPGMVVYPYDIRASAPVEGDVRTLHHRLVRTRVRHGVDRIVHSDHHGVQCPFAHIVGDVQRYIECPRVVEGMIWCDTVQYFGATVVECPRVIGDALVVRAPAGIEEYRVRLIYGLIRSRICDRGLALDPGPIGHPAAYVVSRSRAGSAGAGVISPPVITRVDSILGRGHIDAVPCVPADIVVMDIDP